MTLPPLNSVCTAVSNALFIVSNCGVGVEQQLLVHTNTGRRPLLQKQQQRVHIFCAGRKVRLRRTCGSVTEKGGGLDEKSRQATTLKMHARSSRSKRCCFKKPRKTVQAEPKTDKKKVAEEKGESNNSPPLIFSPPTD